VDLADQLAKSLERLGAAAPQAKAGVRTMLATERKARVAMGRDVADTIARSARRIGDAPRDIFSKRATILRSIKDDAQSMGDRLTSSIHDFRQQARRAAVRQLHVELRAAGVSTSTAHFPASALRSAEDQHHAESSAQSLAAQWRSRASHDALKAQRTERNVANAIADTEASMGHRVERTAVTEVAQAYVEEHRQALIDAVEFDTRYRDGAFAEAVAGLVRQWTSVAGCCPECCAHDGETTGALESFEGGAEPGFMHPRCRCGAFLRARDAAAEQVA
jgi:hypothetical protein